MSSVRAGGVDSLAADSRGDGRHLTVVADARLDNVSEVAGLLPLRAFRQTRASSVILAAYERWGIDCSRKLLGDFAFAVWDTGRRVLCCARDRFGVKPFYYLQSPRLVAFATELNALAALDEFDPALDETRIGSYLLSDFEDQRETFYRHVRRLAPGHVLTVSPDGCREAAYWQLDLPSELLLSNDREYAEGFSTVFAEAVRCRMPSDVRVGAHLSGGLDSSFVSVLARDHLRSSTGLPLPTFSVVFNDFLASDEREYIGAVLEMGGFDPTFVLADHDVAPLLHLCSALERHGEPFYAPNFYLLSATCGAAKQRGIDVLLTGIDGDTVVSHGIDRLGELAAAGSWRSFHTEALGIARHFETATPAMLLRRYAVPQLNALLRERAYLRAGRHAVNMMRTHGRPWRGALSGVHLSNAVRGLLPDIVLSRARANRPGRRRQVFTPSSLNGFMRPAFARRLDLIERAGTALTNGWIDERSERNGHLRRLGSGLHSYVFEVVDREAASFGVETSHPFFDTRMVRFCLSLPSSQKLHEGWTRYVMRQAMDGYLPPEIQWRGGKGHFHSLLTHGMLSRDRELVLGLLGRGLQAVEDYVDVPEFQKALVRFVEGRQMGLELTIVKLVALNRWLSRRNDRRAG